MILAANFGCYWFRIMLDILSKILLTAIWSSCAVWLESERIPFSRTGPRQAVDLVLLLCTGFDQEHVDLFLCPSFTQIPLNHLLLIEAMSTVLVGNKFLPIPWKISSHVEKHHLSLPNIYKALKLFWLSNIVCVTTVVALFPQARLLLPAGSCYCSRLGNILY